jgi:hypothetical protein
MAGRSAEEARRERAAARSARITMRRVRLDEASDDEPVRGPAAISLVTQLTRAAWALSGRPFPTCARAELPYAFVPRERA